ncbi:thioredoxin-like protein, partial [Rhizopus microsporus var. microsporus]
ATWGGPCRRVGPIMHQMAIYHTDILFIKVDTDDHEDIAAEYGTQAIPTTFFFKNGAKADEVIGAEYVSTFEKKIQEVSA